MLQKTKQHSLLHEAAVGRFDGAVSRFETSAASWIDPTPVRGDSGVVACCGSSGVGRSPDCICSLEPSYDSRSKGAFWCEAQRKEWPLLSCLTQAQDRSSNEGCGTRRPSTRLHGLGTLKGTGHLLLDQSSCDACFSFCQQIAAPEIVEDEALHDRPLCDAIAMFSQFVFRFICTIGIVVALCSFSLLFPFREFTSSMAAAGRSFLPLRLFVVVISACVLTAESSISDEVIEAIGARHTALFGRPSNHPAVRYQENWNRVLHVTGLPLYLGVYPEVWEFYTVYGGPAPASPDQATLNLSPQMAVQSVCSFIHRVWPQFYFFEWRAGEVHTSVHDSQVLPRRNRHVLIFSKAAMLQQPSMEAILVEIKWHTADGAKSITAFGHWMSQVTPVPVLLARLGFLRACTLSHRCSLHHNGRYVDGMTMSFVAGDYIFLEGFVIEIPADSDEEPEFRPDPLRQPMNSTSSPTSPTFSDVLMTPSVTTSLSSDDDVPLPDLTINVYRPRGPVGRPLQTTAVLQANARNLDRPCLVRWPDLRPKAWAAFPVHPSYSLAFPQHEFTKHFVVHDPTEAGPRFTTLVMVSAPKTIYLQAMSFMSPLTRIQLLAAVGLQRWCPVHYRNCLTYVNEVLLSAQGQCLLYHGAFLRIDVTGLGHRLDYEALSSFFDVPNDDLGFEHVDHQGVHFFTRPSGSMITTSPPIQGTPCRNHALYWILAAWFCNIVLGWLLYGLCREDRYKPSGQSRAQKRFERKERCDSRRSRRSLVLTYLLLSGQCESLSALQLDISGRVHQHDDYEWMTSGPRLLDGGCPQLRGSLSEWVGNLRYIDPVAQLPPPGNPLYEHPEDLHLGYLRTTLTTKGVQMIDELAFYLNCKFTQSYFNQIATIGRQVSTPSWSSPCLPVVDDTSGTMTLRIGDYLPLAVDALASADYPELPAPATRSMSSSLDAPDADDVSHSYGSNHLPIAQTCFTPETVVDFQQLGQDVSFLGSGNLEEKKQSLNVKGFDQDLDDLFESWEELDSPLFYDNVFDAAFDSLAVIPPVDVHMLSELNIYTDGSHGPSPDSSDSMITTWAFCITGEVEGQIRLVDWFGSHLVTDPSDFDWIGASDETIRGGEASALAFAALWLIQSGFTGTVNVLSDSLTTLNAATGKFGFATGDQLSLRLRALYIFLQQGFNHLHVRHVKAHSGILGNEFADRLAVGIREGRIPPRKPPRHYAEWFQGTPPKILQAGFIFDFTVRPGSLPTFWWIYDQLEPSWSTSASTTLATPRPSKYSNRFYTNQDPVLHIQCQHPQIHGNGCLPQGAACL